MHMFRSRTFSWIAGVVLFPLVSLTAHAAEEAGSHLVEPSPLMIAPFILLLLAIALMPFIQKHWWEKYYPHTAAGLGLLTVLYYAFVLHNPVRMVHSGIEYVSFICLVGSLFVVSGGILIGFKGFSTPLRNTMVLLAGAVLSNLVGTTGASMILIRPFIRNNRVRLRPYHIIFFIFIVSNVGGALTPIGDPPLFLGFLKGVPFFWVIRHVWHIWLLTVGVLLVLFYIIDKLAFERLPQREQDREEAEHEETRFGGLHNLGFLLIILIAVFIQNPPFLRELIMLGAALGSYFTTKKDIHAANDFSFAPIKEVGFLFLGIFATMVPALDWLEINASQLGITTPGQFYFGSGSLSSFLDNAPTYVNFLSAEIGLLVPQGLAATLHALIGAGLPADAMATLSEDGHRVLAALQMYHGDLVQARSVSTDIINVTSIMTLHPIYIMAISVGSVFFGAMSYIGNAPNFMVKSIAEQSGFTMPSFFGYMIRYSLPILLPIFILVWFLFFRI